MSTGSAQQTSTTTAGVSPFAQNYVDAMLGAGQQQVFNMAPGADGKMNITGIKPYVPFGAPMDAQGNVSQYQGGQPQGMGWGAYGGQQQPPQMGFGPAPNNFMAPGADGPSSMVYTPEQAQQGAYLRSLNPNARQQREAQMQGMERQLQGQRQYSASQLGVGEQPLVSMMGPPDLSQLAQPAYDVSTGQREDLSYFNTPAALRGRFSGTDDSGMGGGYQQPNTGYAPGTMQAGMGPGEQLAARSSVAGPSALQQQAYGAAAGMQTPGQYGQATDIGQAAGLGLLNTAGQAQGLQSLAQQAIQQGRQYGQDITNPYRTQAFMSPYMQNVVDIQQREARRASDIAAQAQKGQAVQSGAFGGSRQGVVEAERQRNLATQLGDIQAQGLQSAFQNAQQQQLNAQNQAMQGYGTGIQGYGAGITGQTGAYGAASQGAGTLGALGGQQLNAQQSIANLQNTFGQQQQQNQQQIINQAMQNYQMQRMYPQQQLQYLGSLLSGLPVSSTGQVTNIPAPSLLSQAAGLGTAGLGTYMLGNKLGVFKKGGAIKAPARGGNGLMDVALNKLGA